MFKKLPLKTILNYIAVFTIFTSSWSYNIGFFASLRVSYIVMALIFILWLPILRDLNFNKGFLFAFIGIILFSFFNILTGKDEFGLLSKQVIGILFNSLWFYGLIKINNYDIKKLFKIYLNIAFFVALIGLFQEFSYIIKFKNGYNFSYLFPNFWRITPSGNSHLLRVNSIFPEPIGFCVTILPALFASLISFFKNSSLLLGRFKSSVIIAAFLLSFSLIGYIGIFFAVFLIAINQKRKKMLIITLIFICLSLILMYTCVNDFQYRINDSLKAITGKMALEKTNTSTYALFSNALIAFKSFKNNPLFGSGLGSYELSYIQNIENAVNFENVGKFVSYRDANSLFLRLLSETGLFGVILFFVFLFKYFIGISKDKTGYLWIINNGILIMFALRLIRVGHYFIDGFFFFFWLYYFSKIKLKYHIEIKNISS